MEYSVLHLPCTRQLKWKLTRVQTVSALRSTSRRLIWAHTAAQTIGYYLPGSFIMPISCSFFSVFQRRPWQHVGIIVYCSWTFHVSRTPWGVHRIRMLCVYYGVPRTWRKIINFLESIFPGSIMIFADHFCNIDEK